jgi:hypothetical protein
MNVQLIYRLMLPLLLACALAGAGCDILTRAVLEQDEELPIKNEAGLQALGQQFADAVKQGDFTAAYALSSRELKARQTEEEFVSDLKNNWQLHAKGSQPQATEIVLYMPYRDEFEAWEGISKDIKYASLQGQITLTFGLKVEDEEIIEGFDIDLFVVEEGGQPKVAYLEFYDYSE